MAGPCGTICPSKLVPAPKAITAVWVSFAQASKVWIVGDRLGVDHSQRRLAWRRVLVASVRLARVEVIGELLAQSCAQLVKPDIEHNCLLTTCPDHAPAAPPRKQA